MLTRAQVAGLVSGSVLFAATYAGAQVTSPQAPKLNDAQRAEARSVFQQLIEINTSHSVGSTGAAANAMRQRLLDAGFSAADLVVAGPDERHNNLVARYRGRQGQPRSRFW